MKETKEIKIINIIMRVIMFIMLVCFMLPMCMVKVSEVDEAYSKYELTGIESTLGFDFRGESIEGFLLCGLLVLIPAVLLIVSLAVKKHIVQMVCNILGGITNIVFLIYWKIKSTELYVVTREIALKRGLENAVNKNLDGVVDGTSLLLSELGADIQTRLNESLSSVNFMYGYYMQIVMSFVLVVLSVCVLWYMVKNGMVDKKDKDSMDVQNVKGYIFLAAYLGIFLVPILMFLGVIIEVFLDFLGAIG